MTETRPPAAEAVADRPGPAPAGWLTTGDHKRIGLVYLLTGLLAVAGGAAVAALAALPAVDDTPVIWGAAGSQLIAAAATLVLVVGLPAAWLGVMTYLVPLQIGATRAALPRLQATSAWSLLAGAVVCVVGYALDPAAIVGLGQLLPPTAGDAAEAGTDLVLGGLILVAVATALGAVGVAVTVLNQRADAVTFSRLPAFSWTALATSLMLAITTPVFVSGLALLWIDQHYGGSLFDLGTIAGLRVWQHQLWVFGRPEVLLLALPALGVLTEAVTSAAGRPLVGSLASKVAIVFAVFWALVEWGTPLGVIDSPVVPTPTIATALVGLPVGIVLLTWLGSLAMGKPAATIGLLYAAGFVVLLTVGAAMALVAALVGVEGTAASQAFHTGQITALVVGPGLLGVAAAVAHWAPKFSGRVLPAPAGALQVLAILGGTVLAALPGWLAGLDAATDVSVLASIGLAVLAGGALLSLPGLIPGGTAEPDPTGRGLTLEWAAPSPPPPHNFDSLPPVASAHPLFTEEGA